MMLLGIYALLICAVYCFHYLALISQSYRNVYSSAAISSIGHELFAGCMIAQAFLVCLIAPFITAGIIASEKEKQTFDMLTLTTVPARKLISGEMMAASITWVLMLLTSLPVIGLVLLIGGVSLSELLVLYLSLLLTAILLSAFGLWASVSSRKVSRANASVVIGLILLVIGLPLLSAFPGTRLLACFNPLILFMQFDRSLFLVDFFGWNVPMLPAVLVLMPLATLLITILATRQLDDTVERILSTRQISALFYIIMFVLIAGGWQNPAVGYFLCLFALFTLLLLYIANQMTHPDSLEARMSLGPRPDRLSLFWLHLFLGNAGIMLWMHLTGSELLPVPLVTLVLFVSLTAYWSLGQLMLLVSRSRGIAFRNWFLLVFLLILALPPILGGIGLAVEQSRPGRHPYSYMNTISWTLIATNPIVTMYDLQNQYRQLAFRGISPPWLVSSVFHGIIWLTALYSIRVTSRRRTAKTVDAAPIGPKKFVVPLRKEEN